MIDRSNKEAVSRVSNWPERIGARPHEARMFVNPSAVKGHRNLWDYIFALASRSGVLRLQPWIRREVVAYMGTHLPGLDLAGPYNAVHVRRGDKLFTDAH